MIAYATAEAHALIMQNRDVLDMMVEALIAKGTLSGAEVDTVISDTMTTRARETERQRRLDWQQRQESAARFNASIAAAGAAR